MKPLSTRNKLRVLFYLVILPLLFLPGGCFVRAIVYPASMKGGGPPPPPPLEEIQDIGWVLPVQGAKPGTPVILFFHGNGETLESMRESGTFDYFQAFGCHLIAVEYPGYGRRAGKPSEQGLMESGLRAMAWASQRFPGSPRVLCGWSLGAAVAVRAAAEDSPDGLIAMSPFTSLPDAARAHYPGWLVWLLLRERYDSLAVAPRIHCPTLLLHGEADSLIPPEQSRNLAAAITGARRVVVPGAGHNDLLWKEETSREIQDFLRNIRATSVSSP